MTDEQINKIWRDLQNRYWESNEDMHIRFARALLAASAPNPSDKQEAVAEIVRYETFTGRTAWDIKIRDTSLKNGALLYAAPPAQSAEQDRIDAELCFLDDDEITEAANKFQLGNPRFDTLRCFVNYVIIVAQHKGASK